MLVSGLDIASELFLELDRPEPAALLVGHVDGPAATVSRMRLSTRDHDVLCAEIRTTLGDARYQELIAEGAGQTIDEIAAVTISTIDEIAGTE